MEKVIKDIIYNYVDKYMENPDIVSRWKKPLIAFADAKDPLFSKLKEVANPNHLLPEDILEGANSAILFFAICRVNSNF